MPENPTNEELYEKAISAIRALFSDTSVSSETARENLQGIIDETQTMLDTLPE